MHQHRRCLPAAVFFFAAFVNVDRTSRVVRHLRNAERLALGRAEAVRRQHAWSRLHAFAADRCRSLQRAAKSPRQLGAAEESTYFVAIAGIALRRGERTLS